MAPRGRILAATFLLSCAVLLPLLASADRLNGDDTIKTGRGQGHKGRKGGISIDYLLPPPQDPAQPSPPPPPEQWEPEPPADGPEPEPANPAGLQEGFYRKMCPQAEKIITETITKHFRKDPTLAPSLVRLFLHDCMVNGCDASILLDATPTGEDVEKKALANGPFVRGFEAIDDIKTQLEAECPGVVSCADILAYTNRDSLVFTGVPRYEVAAGRRDGLVSLAKNVDPNIPLPTTGAQEMIRIFHRKGLTLEDLVVLTGAHSIGNCHCNLVSGRFWDPAKSKDMDQGYVTKMRSLTLCQNDTQDIAFDPYSHHKMDSRFYNELLKKRALLESDESLTKEPRANRVMRRYANDQKGWLERFILATKKLGDIEVLTGNQGEIRKNCRAVNQFQ